MLRKGSARFIGWRPDTREISSCATSKFPPIQMRKMIMRCRSNRRSEEFAEVGLRLLRVRLMKQKSNAERSDSRRTMMQKNTEVSNSESLPRGRLAIVGSGITAIAHLTLETIGYIQYADVVFYHANSGVIATHIRELNPN